VRSSRIPFITYVLALAKEAIVVVVLYLL